MAVIAFIGTVLVLAAFILLLLTTINTPIIKSINFLNFTAFNVRVDLGTYGYCIRLGTQSARSCSLGGLGSQYDEVFNLLALLGVNTSVLPRGLIRSLTIALGVIHPIATGLAFLALIFALCSSITAHVIGGILCFFAAIVTAVVLGIDLAAFIITRDRIEAATNVIDGSLGNGLWLVAAATGCLFIGSFFVCCGGISSRKRRRSSKHASTATGSGGYDSATTYDQQHDYGAYGNQYPMQQASPQSHTSAAAYNSAQAPYGSQVYPTDNRYQHAVV